VGAGLLTHATEASLPELSDETRRDLSRQHREDVLEKHPATTDQNIVGRVTRLYREMLRAGDLDPGRFNLMVTDDDTVNAYSFIGGNLVITTGFMDFAGEDDDMVCFVVAHELGHLQLGHTELPYRRARAAGTLGPAGSVAHGMSEQVMRMSPVSQAQERDADCFAVRLLRASRRSVDGGLRFFTRIDQLDDDRSPADSDEVIGALFGSHPQIDRRIDNILNGCDAR
jgi:putative metalloprotease